MFFVQTAKNVVGRILVSDIFSAPKNLVLRTSVGFENPTYAHLCKSVKGRLKQNFQTAFCFTAVYSGRICGNKITSRMLGASVSSITKRSSPMPQPPVGGRPYSMARM